MISSKSLLVKQTLFKVNPHFRDYLPTNLQVSIFIWIWCQTVAAMFFKELLFCNAAVIQEACLLVLSLCFLKWAWILQPLYFLSIWKRTWRFVCMRQGVLNNWYVAWVFMNTIRNPQTCLIWHQHFMKSQRETLWMKWIKVKMLSARIMISSVELLILLNYNGKFRPYTAQKTKVIACKENA